MEAITNTFGNAIDRLNNVKFELRKNRTRMNYYKRLHDRGYYYKIDSTGGLEVRSLPDFERISTLTEDSIDRVMSDVKHGKLIEIDSEEFYQAYNKTQEAVNKLLIKIN